MADFDPDAYLAAPAASAPAAAPGGFDPDAYLATKADQPSAPITPGGVAKAFAVGVPLGGLSVADTAMRGMALANPLAAPLVVMDSAQRVGHRIGDFLTGTAAPPTMVDQAATALNPVSYIGGANDWLSNKIQELHQPQNVAERAAQTLGEFMPGLIGGGETEAPLALRALTRVAAPAAASEAAGYLTQGKWYEPYARMAAGLAGGIGAEAAGPAARNAMLPGRAIPTVEDLHEAANQGYLNARGYGVEINRKPVANLGNGILTDLETDGFRERNTPKTWSAVQELQNPSGRNVTIDDIDSVRKALNRAGSNPLEGAEREASRRAIAAIDNYVSTLDPAEVAVNPHYAGDVAQEIGDSRGNWAAMRRSEQVQGKLEDADLQAAATGSGANINNAIRQKIKSILTSPKARRGFSADELGQMERVVRGTFVGNAARLLGKLAPTGIVSGSLGLEIGSHLIGGPAGIGAVPILGAVAKRVGDASTARQARILDEMVRARSPLADQAAAPPARVPVSPMSAGLIGAEAEQSGNYAAGGRVVAENIDHAPSEAQKKAGNYAKDHVHIHGLDITIENAKGAMRSGVGRDGRPWSVKMPAHYGYIKGTVGRDKDHVDVYIGPHPKSPHAFVVDQMDAETGRFDEHKVMLGFSSLTLARRAYLAGFSDGKGERRLGHMEDMPVAVFKRWLDAGETTERAKGVADAHKLSHKAVGYVMKSRSPNKHCSVCSMFREGECTLVKEPIVPGGWCRRFDPKE